MVTQQVVEPVPARLRLLQQVGVDEVLQGAFGNRQVQIGQGGRGVGVHVQSGDQSEQPEQAPLHAGELLVRQRERGGHAQILGGELGQPPPLVRQP